MVTFKIDDRAIECPEGLTVFEAAKREGILIPSFCFHEATGIQGDCRLCLVQIDTRVVTSCQTPVQEGLEVRTDTEAVISAREKQIEFMLIHHPVDCPVCDEGGECLLQEMTFLFGPRHRRYRGEVRQFKSQYMGPFIAHEVTRCIRCGLCVRFYQDVAGGTDFATLNAADKVYFGRYEEGRLESEFSGNIIEMCPTGTLLDKTFLHKARIWDLNTAPSICPHCSAGCNTLAGAKRDKLLRIRNRFNPEVNGWFNCDLGRFGSGYVNCPERVAGPLQRLGNGLNPVGWDEALGVCAERLKLVIEKWGPGAVGVLGSTRSSTEACYLLSRLFQKGLGCANIDCFADPFEGRSARSAWETVKKGYGRTTSMPEIEGADFILVAGVDVTSEVPVMALRLRRAVKNGAALVLINLRGGNLDALASIRLYEGPIGTARALDGISGRLLGAAKGLPDKLEEAGFTNWKGFCERVGGKPTPAGIEDVCIALEGSKKPVIISAARYSKEAANLSLVVEAMKGERPGLNFVFDGSNTPGALEAGLVPAENGMDIKAMVDAAVAGRLKALFVMENDALSRYPHRKMMEEAIDDLEFLVVQDVVFTPTAGRADLVLPSTSHFETSGTFINYEGRVQRFDRALAPVEGARPGWRILKELSVRMGVECGFGSPEEVWEALSGEVETFEGMADLAAAGGEGSRLAAAEGVRGFFPGTTETGSPPSEYPYTLVTGRVFFGTEDLSNRAPVMAPLIPALYVELSSRDADKEGVGEGDEVRVMSVNGELSARARVSERTPSGVVFMPRGFPEGPVNRLLTDHGRDYVRIERCRK